MSRRGLEWSRALCIWLFSGGLYAWLGGPSLQFLWMLCSSMVASGLLLAAFGPKKITISRQIAPSCLYAGEEAEITVTLRFASWLPLPWIMLTERIGGHTVRMLWFPGFRRSVCRSYKIRPEQRGNWPAVDARVEWGDMFGWFRSHRAVRASEGLTVLPRPLSLRGMTNLHRGPEGEPISAPSAYSSAGGQEIRDYMAGDPLNRIHWKNSARLGRLQTLLPQAGQSGRRFIILDTSRDGYPVLDGSLPEETFENVVSVTAGLLYSSAVSLEQTTLRIGRNGRPPVRFERTPHGEDHEMLVPLADICLQNESRVTADLLEESAEEDSSSEILVVTGRLSEAMAAAAVRLLAAGRKLGIYCTHPIFNVSRGASHDLSGTRDGAVSMSWRAGGNTPEDRFLAAGGRLFYVASGGDICEVISGKGGHGKDGSFERLVR